MAKALQHTDWQAVQRKLRQLFRSAGCGELSYLYHNTYRDTHHAVTVVETTPDQLILLHKTISAKRDAVKEVAKIPWPALQLVSRDQWGEMFGGWAGDDIADYFSDPIDRSIEALLRYTFHGVYDVRRMLLTWQPLIGDLELGFEYIDNDFAGLTSAQIRERMKIKPRGEAVAGQGVGVVPLESHLAIHLLYAP